MTFTPTFTHTPHPASKLVALGTPGPWTAGVGAAVTFQVQNALSPPMTLGTALLVSVTSDSVGDHDFSPSTQSIPPGQTNVTVTYRDHLAGTHRLTAFAPAMTPGVCPVTVLPAAPVSLLVLWPFESPLPGRPITAPAGYSSSGAVSPTAGDPVTATIRLVDEFFNTVPLNDTISFTLSDTAAPIVASQTLSQGMAQVALLFVTPNMNANVTVTDANRPPINGRSTDLTILAGFPSTVLNVVHNSPDLTTVVKGQGGVTLMSFIGTIGSGTNPIQIEQCVLRVESPEGSALSADSAFSNLALMGDSSGGPVTILAGGLAGSSVTFNIPIWTFVARYTQPVTFHLVGDVSAGATAELVRLSLPDNISIVAHDLSMVPAVGLSSQGDPTGFPMRSQTLVLRGSSLAETFGNYPNPFKAGLESTTIEFYLPATGTADLVVYDCVGREVVRLLSGASLAAGLQRVTWDGHNGQGKTVLNGLYFVKLKANGDSQVIKVAVSR